MDPGVVTRSIIESIVARTAEVIAQITTVCEVGDVILFGGATRVSLLARRLAESIGRDVRTGSPEAAALGNAIVQGLAIGEFSDLAEGRAKVSTDRPGKEP